MSALEGSAPAWVKWTGLAAGPLLALAAYLLIPDAIRDGSGQALAQIGHAGRAAAAVGIVMAVWWLSEALPLEATALLPIVLFPLLGVATVRNAAAPYASDVIFLFMGGLMLGFTMERWGLHTRIALRLLSMVGTSPSAIIGGVMLATAFIAAWVSNTATAVMMLPIGMSIAAVAGHEPHGRPGASANFAPCLMLGIAYAASIGGIGTLVGTPPNTVLRGFVETHPELPEITFRSWLWIGVPTLAIFLPLAWVVLTRMIFPVPTRSDPILASAIREQTRALGPMSRAELLTLLVFLGAAGAWIFREFFCDLTGLFIEKPGGRREYPFVTDAGIAITAALLLFSLPVSARRREFLLDWPTASRIPWGVLVLFGGGLSLAEAVGATGLDKYLGALFGFMAGVPPLVVVLALTASMVFLSEVASNTAVATTFMPIAYAASERLGIHPFLLLFPVAMGASYAFMMPMGTPPNALVFASGRVTIRQMVRAGFVLNICAIVVITLLVYFAAPTLLGFQRTAPRPDSAGVSPVPPVRP